jgi:hypothetical protein
MRGTVALVLALALAACVAPPRVALTEDWPARAGDFDDVTRAWTREATLHRGYQEVLSVGATFKSPAWRVAHATKVARSRGLDETATAALLAAEKAAADKEYAFELIVTTWDRRENELARPNPVWTVTLIDGTGRSINPVRIERDKRPKHVLRAEFPVVGDFAEAYVAYFPHDPPVLGPGVKTMRLRLSSARGNVEVAWDAP